MFSHANFTLSRIENTFIIMGKLNSVRMLYVAGALECWAWAPEISLEAHK
jgi:hypothetical protein